MNSRTIRSAIVTGPTGAVGCALCKKLLGEGVRTYAIVRPGSARTASLPVDPLISVVPCEMSDYRRLPECLPADRMDAFFHLAWADTTGEGRDDPDSQLRNVRCALDAVKAAHELGCRVFVGTGSQAEYGRVEGRLSADTPTFPESGYGIAKLCAGQLTRLACARMGLDHVWVRILSVYGPGDGANSMISGVIRQLLRGETPALTLGEQQWDYLYSADAAEGLYLCAARGRSGGVYPLGSGRAAPLRRYVEALRDAIDPALALGFGRIPYGPRQVMHLEADISALRADTGFEPATDFDQGIKDTIDWVKSTL